MSTGVKRFTVWTAEPRRTGVAWAWSNARRVLHFIRLRLLSRFISLLGTICVPGVRPVGALQAWALRCMGARCASGEIWIGPRVCFDYPANLVLGRRVVIGADSRLTARDEVVIGDDFLSAPGLHLNTGTHDLLTLVPQSSPITIGPGVWCGARVTICAGVTIGEHAIIGAGSLVLHDVPAWHLAHGVPCRPQRDLEAARRGLPMWSNFRSRRSEKHESPGLAD